MKTLLGKPLEIYGTDGWNKIYGGTRFLRSFLEMPDKSHFHIRLAGYHLKTGALDEKTVAFKSESLNIKPFWLKIDDYGDKYVGTFLFPDEY